MIENKVTGFRGELRGTRFEA